ncbi:ATP-binding protein, partial [Clostridium butyricum]
NIGGTGIGLSLLKSISKSFDIKIKVNSEYGVGSEFILDIPKVTK